MKFRAVIFDLFGTLIENFRRTEYEKVLGEMAAILEAPEADFRRLWAASFILRTTGVHRDQRDSIEYICRELGIKPHEEQIEHAFQVRLDYTRRSMKTRTGALETLAHLKRAGYKIGLISDCSGEIPMVWSETPLAGYFDATIFSCLAGVKKPDPRIYRMATDSLGVKPEECLYIGDGSSKELTGARQAGMRAVLIRDPDESGTIHLADREENWGGEVIATLKEVPDLLR